MGQLRWTACLILGFVLATSVSAEGALASEQRSVAVLEKLGATVQRDDGQPGKPVISVELAFKKITDADLVCLKDLPRLERLELVGCPVTGEGLACLKHLPHLRYLGLSSTRITDANLAHLRTLSSLRRLNLQLTEVGDGGMVHVSRLHGLRELLLSRTRLTDKGLATLSVLKAVRSLSLDMTRITDAGLASLRGMTHLRELALDYTCVTDKGLVYVMELHDLGALDLSNTRVTDAGLASLQKFRALRSLRVKDTAVTAKAAYALERNLPETEVEYSRPKGPRYQMRQRKKQSQGAAAAEHTKDKTAVVPAPTVAQVLGWLPARTETVIVSHGPFKMKAWTPEDNQSMPTAVAELLQDLPMGLLDFNDAGCMKLLAGIRIELAIEGSRNFESPRGLGMGLYDGCQIIVFHEELPPAVDWPGSQVSPTRPSARANA